MRDRAETVPLNYRLSTSDAFKHVMRLIKEYFLNSEQAYWALLLLLCSVLGVLSLVGLTILLYSNVGIFFQTIAVLNLSLFIETFVTILLIALTAAAVKYFTSYVSGMLAADWRAWLTQRMFNQYAQSDSYVILNREQSDIQHIEVTLVDSIREFVELTLSLGTSFLQNILTLPTYMRTLWVVGGALTLVALGINIVIPGYLVLVAILLTVIASAVVHYIGRVLKNWINVNTDIEGSVRQEVAFVTDHADSLALTRTIHIHQNRLFEQTNHIRNNSYQMSQIQAAMDAFNDFYQPIAFLFPYVVMAPLYFAQKISEGDFYSAGYAFSQVQASLNWFIDSYDLLSKYTASIERIVELEQALQRAQQLDDKERICLKTDDNNVIQLKNVNITKTHASSTDYIMRNLNVMIDPTKNTFIKGASGLGKSTLFKVLAGTWKSGQGNIYIPMNHQFYFMPQQPLIPAKMTLRALLDYSDKYEQHTDADYQDVLQKTGMGEFVDDLDNTNKDWTTLSGGQRQSLAVARLLLKKQKPQLIFLDEATSAMDEARQTLIYNLLTNLEGTKIVSIAHRTSVAQFHDDVIDLSINEDRYVTATHSMH
jgi:putative ATP-binding cassette transporter